MIQVLEKRRRPHSFAIALTSLGLIAVPLAAWRAWNSEWNMFNDPFNDWTFDRGTWINQPDQRGRMFASLRDRLLVGRPSRDQVQELLGEPDDELRESDDHCWSYYLGWWSGLRIDSDALCITFSRQGNVEKVWRVQY